MNNGSAASDTATDRIVSMIENECDSICVCNTTDSKNRNDLAIHATLHARNAKMSTNQPKITSFFETGDGKFHTQAKKTKEENVYLKALKRKLNNVEHPSSGNLAISVEHSEKVFFWHW